MPICAECVKECSCISTKSMRTSRAVIPTCNMAIGFDVASTYFTPIWTRFLIAPLALSFHRASPRLGRCAKHNSKTGFPGLEAQHLRRGAALVEEAGTGWDYGAIREQF